MGNADGTRPRRDPQRTRRALLDGAAAAVRAHGAGVSVEVIARTACVSKSGLLHHFASKEQLFVALAQDAYARFESEVDACTDAADLAPGRVMRGYLRATFADLGTDTDGADYWSVIAHLSVVPAVLDVARADFRRWESRLTADGFDPGVMRVIVLAANGAATDVGDLSDELAARLLDQLVALTFKADALAVLMDAAS